MNFWKFRALITQSRMLEEQAQNLLREAASLKNKAFKDAELDPTKNYSINDETETVEEVIPKIN